MKVSGISGIVWFEHQGGQYQTLINEVLRRYRDHYRGRRVQ